MRICSLLPSATEIVGCIGLQGDLVAISHECDVSPDREGLEKEMKKREICRVTSSPLNPVSSSFHLPLNVPTRTSSRSR